MNQITIVQIKNKVRRLEERLNEGWELIDMRATAGDDVTALEDFFEQLLHEYEAAADELAGLERTVGRAA